MVLLPALQDPLALAVFAAACLAAASTGAFFKPGAWYAALSKPWWTPPNWLFPIAWTALFAAIAWAGYLVWLAAGWGAAAVLGLYFAHLLVNAAWSWLFFGRKRMDWAFVNVCALFAMIAALIIAIAPIHRGAALLLAPYLAWVGFAAALNYALLRRNPRAA